MFGKNCDSFDSLILILNLFNKNRENKLILFKIIFELYLNYNLNEFYLKNFYWNCFKQFVTKRFI
jgi:hypothetical protein